jgi:hypothetical protein
MGYVADQMMEASKGVIEPCCKAERPAPHLPVRHLLYLSSEPGHKITQ